MGTIVVSMIDETIAKHIEEGTIMVIVRRSSKRFEDADDQCMQSSSSSSSWSNTL